MFTLIYNICYNFIALKKKLTAQGKKKGYEVLINWLPSINNHLYWCAATSGGDGELVKAKWRSITNHVCNIHANHCTIFPSCLHEPIDERDWIAAGEKVSVYGRKQENKCTMTRCIIQSIMYFSASLEN